MRFRWVRDCSVDQNARAKANCIPHANMKRSPGDAERVLLLGITS